MVGVILVGAGRGTRLKRKEYKALVKLGGRELVFHALRRFNDLPAIRRVVVVLPRPCVKTYDPKIMRRFPLVQRVVVGGSKRRDSVAAGLAALDPGCDIVLVHDAARPLVSRAVIAGVIRGAKKYGACIPAVAPSDTLKTVRGGFVEQTLDRTKIVSVQTPQGFARRIIERAYGKALRHGYDGSDDAGLVERLGIKVRVVPGDEKNFKITRPADLEVASILLSLRAKAKQSKVCHSRG